MYETKGFKIFIYLILTLMAVGFWLYIQASLTSDVGQRTYEDAVFVENSSYLTGKEEDVLWRV